MKRSIYLAFTVLLLGGVSGCTSYNYYTAAINKTNLSGYHTFAWMPPASNGNKQMTNNLADAKIKDAVTSDLVSKGFRLSQRSPDLVVNYTITVGRGTRTNYYSPYNYGGWGPGWGWGWGWGGWGWGFGWGWGWPGWGWGWGYPGYIGYNPYWWGYPSYGYPGYGISYSDQDYSSSNQGYDNQNYSNNSNSNSNGDYSFSANNNLGVAAPGTITSDNNSVAANENDNVEPPADYSSNTNPITGNVAASTPTALIYLKDGTTYAASDYWLQGGQLHYTVNYGGESTLSMDEVDLQRTVDENARRGIHFSLKPNPSRVSSQPRQNQNNASPAIAPAPSSDPALQSASQSQT